MFVCWQNKATASLVSPEIPHPDIGQVPIDRRRGKHWQFKRHRQQSTIRNTSKDPRVIHYVHY